MKLDILGDEEIEAIIDKAIVDYEDVEMTDQEWEDKQLELVAKAQAKMTAKQIMSDLDRLSVEHKDDTDFLASVGQYLKELEEAIK
ncbi:hypothetical protein LCGC14_1442610 [marine sediment metagenome]|uniref:Uncharacterized protein n=1 Tax=marine sediment metagenome TaxID=412755 RepID=A0A0F9MM31_9ZZZZ